MDMCGEVNGGMCMDILCEGNGGMCMDTCVKEMEGCVWIHVLREWRDVC